MSYRSLVYVALAILPISEQFLDVSAISCRPEKGTNCTSNLAFGLLNELRDNAGLKENDGASMNCKVIGQDKFVNSEFIFPSEPPYSVHLEIGSELSSLLHDSTILCSVDSISPINRPTPDEDAQYRRPGNVLYTCNGGVNLKISFLGMIVLLRDLYGHGCEAPLFSPGSIDSCVKDTEVPSKKRMETGFYCGDKSVSIPMRYMYINQSYFDCSQCCPGNYWSTKYKKCAKCDDCVTNMEPNVWTQCYDFSSCQSTNTSSTTLPTSTKPYAPGIPTTLPVTTPLQILAPAIAPGEPQIKSENVTLMIFRWKLVKGTKKSPIDYYEVEYSIKESLLAQSLNTTIAEIGIKNLKLCQDYEVNVRAGNLKGVGPWSDILQFQSPGENPKRKPQNVKLLRQERIVTISWDKITASHGSFEEPVLGFRIEYWPLGKTTNKRVITTKLNLINITVGDKGYNISVHVYNRCGAGPPVYKETNPNQVIRANEHSKGWIVAVVIIVLMVLGGGGVLFVIFKLRRKRNRRRQDHSATYTPVNTGDGEDQLQMT